jgi:flagellar biosynthesis protein FlhF
MDLRTYRARSLQEALRLVREDLGPDASVLHTRDVAAGISRWLGGAKEIEVTASAEVQVPSRLQALSHVASEDGPPTADTQDYRSKFRADLFRPQGRGAALEELCRHAADVGQTHRAARLRKLEQDICCRGPLRIGGARPKVVAFVGPTGVGKTTSIAKLAAHFALQQRRRVGLITVDTFRIAAAEQLRTYADIMDLPLSVASSLDEVQSAVSRMSDLDLILLDTAGRGPRDDQRLAELRPLLAAAEVSETILVLSAAASLESCQSAAAAFSRQGATSLLLTKLDEATSLAGLTPLLCNPHLPLSYVTDGQNVPDDISVADPRRLSERMLGERTVAGGAS